MTIEDARDDEALERSAAYDELLRSRLEAGSDSEGESDSESGSVLASVADVPSAAIIRLLHEVFRTPRSDPAPTPEPLPDRVGRFVIHRLLGRGAFGCVYLAHDPILRRQVALKVFHQHLLADKSTRRHVLREREIMARLQHSNIVPVWEAGEENELLYIASEYCPGPTLAEWLAAREQRATEQGRSVLASPESLRQCADWICRLADAVHHSHERGVVHRDLKPGNVLLEPHGDAQTQGTPSPWRPRLTDFGLAKYFHAVQDETRSGLFVGSLEYASPEQVRSQPDAVGPASDIYSLGVLLYELLTDQMPHTADSDYDLARKICEQDVAFPPELRRTLPRDLQAITLRALERQPRERYASAADMRDDLQRFLSGEFVRARPVSLPERAIRCARKNPDVATLSGLCICFAMLLVGALIRNNQQLTFHSTQLKQALVETQTHEKAAQRQRVAARAMQARAEESERQARSVGYLANMRLAYEAWEKNNLKDVRELLEQSAAQAPSLRGVDWYLLHQELAARCQWLPRLKEPVFGLAYQPSSGSLLTVNDSGQVRRWDLQANTLSEEFQAGAGAHAIAIAPDTKTMALGQRVESPFGLSTLALWDLEHHKQGNDTLHYHSTTLESVEYSADGKWLASGPRYNPVVVTNLANGEAFAIPSARRNTQLAFSPSGDRLAVNTAISAIEIHELATRKVLLTIDTSAFKVASFVWLPGREVIAINARTGWGMHFYSTRTGKRLAALPTPHVGESLTVSADGRSLALGSEEGRLQVFDVSELKMADDEANGSALPEPPVDSPPSPQVLGGFVTDIEFVGESRVAASDDEGNLACLDLEAHAYRRFYRKEAFWTNARWENEDTLTIFSRQRPPERRSWRGRPGASSSFPVDIPLDEVTSADGKLRAAFTTAGELAVTDAKSGKMRFLARSNSGNFSGGDTGSVTEFAAISTKNNLVYTTGENNRLTAWNADDGTIVWEDVLTNTGRVIVEHPATGRLFVGGDFESLRVYDSRSGELLADRAGGNGAMGLVIDSVHGRIISGHCDGTLRIRNLDLSDRATIHRTHGNELTAVTLSPDGRSIISGDADGIIRIWRADGQSLGVIYRSPIAEAQVRKFLWSPSGEQLVALVSGRDGASELVCWKVGLEISASQQADAPQPGVAKN